MGASACRDSCSWSTAGTASTGTSCSSGLTPAHLGDRRADRAGREPAGAGAGRPPAALSRLRGRSFPAVAARSGASIRGSTSPRSGRGPGPGRPGGRSARGPWPSCGAVGERRRRPWPWPGSSAWETWTEAPCAWAGWASGRRPCRGRTGRPGGSARADLDLLELHVVALGVGRVADGRRPGSPRLALQSTSSPWPRACSVIRSRIRVGRDGQDPRADLLEGQLEDVPPRGRGAGRPPR